MPCTPQPKPRPDHPALPPRRCAAAALGLAVLAMHLAGLRWLQPAPLAREPQAPAPLQLWIASTTRAAAPSPSPGPGLRAAARVVAAPARAARLPLTPTPPPSPPSSPHRAADSAEPRPPESAPPWPRYAATPPPPGLRHYRLQRGERSSPARLAWTHDTQAYSLSLMAEGGDLDGLGAASRGHIGPEGLVPERHVERRRGRDQRATNFHLAEQQFRGSGGGQAHVWPAGGQDRLSWLLQLAAVLQADSTLARPGAQLLLPVAGPRGPAAAWLFVVRGPEDVMLADGSPRPALALQRLAERPYDLQVDVWLDPADHHLPLRLQLAAPPGDWASLWLLEPRPVPLADRPVP